MAANVPAKLKAADITRFAHRAAQLEKVKPVVAYWCDYWIVNQIISKGLHAGDEATMRFTTDLMDKLETMKAENADNDAISDDMAGQAYVEHFALETFQRADNAIRSNRASKQTADTFQAAGTFLDLLQIWGTPDQEISSKSKYAKFHALRILKAIKAGEDPNLSNPTPEPSPIDESESLNPTVEDVPDDLAPRARSEQLNEASVLNASDETPSHHQDEVKFEQTAPSPETIPTVNTAQSSSTLPGEDVSPLEPSPIDRKASDASGYFPAVPAFDAEPSAPSLPAAPQDLRAPTSFSDLESPPDRPAHFPLDHETHPSLPQSTYNPPSQPSQTFSAPLGPMGQQGPTPQDFYSKAPFVPTQSNSMPPSQKMPGQPESFNIDDEAILNAQKHARWAISALNFEDVNTAVKELRVALNSLGAR